MKRTAMKRTAWPRREWERAARADRPMAPLRRVECCGTYAGGTTGPAPKSKPYRDRALLDLAEGRPCLLLIPGCCSHRTDTVVAAHSNWQDLGGKAGRRKADDHWSCAACHSCHAWLDTGPASAQQKRAAFLAGLALQIMAWQNIAAASDEPLRFRNAARRALERHGELT